MGAASAITSPAAGSGCICCDFCCSGFRHTDASFCSSRCLCSSLLLLIVTLHAMYVVAVALYLSLPSLLLQHHIFWTNGQLISRIRNNSNIGCQRLGNFLGIIVCCWWWCPIRLFMFCCCCIILTCYSCCFYSAATTVAPNIVVFLRQIVSVVVGLLQDLYFIVWLLRQGLQLMD